MTELVIYTDGSASPYTKDGGWSFVLKDRFEGITDVHSGKARNTTNNRMEMQAVIEALDFIIKNSYNNVVIRTDSEYVVKGTLEWSDSWKAKGWKNIKNKDLWVDLLSLFEESGARLEWVKGHSNDIGNEMADRHAVLARKS